VLDDILSGFAARGATLAFTLTRQPVSLAFQVLRGAVVVAAPPVSSLVPGPQSLTWNGTLTDGTPAPDGAYTLALTITDDVGTFTRVLKAAGVTQFRLKATPASYVLTATDGAGNVTTLRYRR
jgi:hypothetical protein